MGFVESGINYLDEPDTVAAVLAPLRRKLLAKLREPASATQLAAALGLPRQKVNYHLRALESAGLIELVEERRRRGCLERIMRARPGAVVVDPTVMSHDQDSSAEQLSLIQDQYAAEHLVDVAAATVRDVARMQVKADEAGKRLLTFTAETDVRFASPADVHRFTDELTEALREIAARFDTRDGRPYRVVVGGHPTPRPTGEKIDQGENP
ncbi:helix-turn-helix domain-containing protein [Actinomadura kijaniata]|uniref:DNA-binding transcriptional ArsR family regulator n=1 Tax=Actinomadura namibiensis TaxID=182080 RepID=A0A7W3LXI8_ACTNM|nr:helix-turn-helix domain-containing protein [Actinomadura namibiensis]MBA8956072.1 DNA-binding transcriptional ArsR family regulator [Actinomadura namibiensis]